MKTESVNEKVGDYRIIIYTDGHMSIIRHEEPWQSTDDARDDAGWIGNSNVISALAHEVERLRTHIAEMIERRTN